MVLIMIGAFAKSAQFPFHFWLLAAMEAPTAAYAFLHSATMVKLGVYILARFDPVFSQVPAFGTILVAIGSITMLAAAVRALMSDGYKAVLAQSTVASLAVLIVLIGLEVAIATFALIITVLYARATSNYFAIPFGFESENIVTFRLDVPEYKYAEPLAAARVLTSVHERLQRLPSIKATGASTRLPLNLGARLPSEALTIEDRPDIPSEQYPWAITVVVTPS